MSSNGTGSCPGSDALARALEGDDPVLSEHVAVCEHCQERLSALVVDTDLICELREISHPDPQALGSDAPQIEGLEIVRELHRGGQGIVYEAIVRATGQGVAVKVLLAGRWATSKDLRRFQREVDLVATLDHPNIITLYEAGRAAGGSPYYSMELVEGVPLDRYVQGLEEEGGTISLDQRLEIFLAVASAIEHAHLHGVIHRDLKPANILIDGHGTPCVLDFGLAKNLAPDAEATLTRTGDFVGSPAWAAPEQVRGTSGAIDVHRLWPKLLLLLANQSLPAQLFLAYAMLLQYWVFLWLHRLKRICCLL
jgi:serine/threonine-protein kinase